MVFVVKKYGIKIILDNIWVMLFFFDVYAYGIDISVEVGIKYLGGYLDFFIGLVFVNEECWSLLRLIYDVMVMLLGVEDC